MAITWEIKRDVVNIETELSKITATRVDNVKGTSHSFFAKGLMKSPTERKKLWDNIWTQWLVAKTPVIDVIVVDTKNNLEERESS